MTRYYAIDDIEITKGDDWKPVYKWVNADDTPLDITGFSFALAIKQYETDPAPLHEVTGVITDAINGEFYFLIPAATTSTLDLGTYYYDVQVIDSGGIKITRIKGKLIVSWEAVIT
jgi:hypothetical protein